MEADMSEDWTFIDLIDRADEMTTAADAQRHLGQIIAHVFSRMGDNGQADFVRLLHLTQRDHDNRYTLFATKNAIRRLCTVANTKEVATLDDDRERTTGIVWPTGVWYGEDDEPRRSPECYHCGLTLSPREVRGDVKHECYFG